MPTRWGPILMCGWPGLAGLWFRGHFSSLLVAIGFSLLLNLTLITSFLWPWYLGETFPAIAWPTIFLVWIISAIVTFSRLPDYLAIPTTSEKVADQSASDTLFIQAQGEYLRGHWEEAASLLQRQLLQSPRDVEARLLLATLYRHNRKFDHARIEIREMEKFDEAYHWQFEIERERDLLQLIQQHESKDNLESQSAPPVEGVVHDSIENQTTTETRS